MGRRIGDCGPLRNLVAWVGAVYQEVEETHRGSIALPPAGRVSYDVELEQKEAWNAAAGISARVAQRWQLDLEAGGGDRVHASGSLSYRF
jgi:hypothetical protein